MRHAARIIAAILAMRLAACGGGTLTVDPIDGGGGAAGSGGAGGAGGSTSTGKPMTDGGGGEMGVSVDANANDAPQ